MSEFGEGPWRLLPRDVTVDTPWSLEGGDVESRAEPPTFEEIAAGIAPAGDPDKWFSTVERSSAAWLRGRGLDVLSVQRREGNLLKTPDAVIVTPPATIEIKSATGTLNSIVQRVRSGRWQSRRVMVDVRGTGTTPATAESAVRAALIRYQRDLDEVIIVVSDDLSVGWSHG